MKLGIFEGRDGGFLGTATAIGPDGEPRTSPDELEPGDWIIVDGDVELDVERLVTNLMRQLAPMARGRLLSVLERLHRQAAEHER